MTEIRVATPPGALERLSEQQTARNQQLLKQTPTLGDDVRSDVLPFAVDLGAGADRRAERALAALEKTAARIAIESLVSLAKVNDIDHLGGGLELIGRAADDARRRPITSGRSSRSSTGTPASATTPRCRRSASCRASASSNGSAAASTSPATSRGCPAARRSARDGSA